MKIRIKIIVSVIIIVSAITFLITSCLKPDEKNPACTGKDRWDIKILTDINASVVNYVPSNTTIEALISIPLLNTIKDNTPRFGIEFNTYTLNCRIREFKLSSDGDYHLVLQSLSSPSTTMVGEIPDPHCESVKQSICFNQFTKARTDFKNSLLATAQVDTAVYTITGVAFYDKIHGQLGAAPNAIEIHPILSISKH